MGNRRNLERAGLESFVPDRQTVAIPVEDLETVAASIDEQEQVAGRRVLGEGCGHQPGDASKPFRRSVAGVQRNTLTV